MLGRLVLASYDCDRCLCNLIIIAIPIIGSGIQFDSQSGAFYLDSLWSPTYLIWNVGACISFMIVVLIGLKHLGYIKQFLEVGSVREL